MVGGDKCHETSNDLDEAAASLSDAERRILYNLAEEAAKIDRSEAFGLFLALCKDARLLSLVELAMGIDSEDLDQLLFAAEDYYSDAVLAGKANR